jgi:hypothetical protein
MNFDQIADEAERQMRQKRQLQSVSFWLGFTCCVVAVIGTAIVYPKLFALGLLAYAGRILMELGDD